MEENNYSMFEESDPRFNTGLGAVILLDELFRMASGYLLMQDIEKYYNSLESIYIELASWLDVKKYEGIRNEIQEIRKQFNEIEEDDLPNLKEYHILLNTAANKAGLRLKEARNSPGVVHG